jgi:DNA topoisomerase-1
LFIGCTAYPDCDYTRNLGDDSESAPEIVEGRSCPECESPLLVRHGRYGKFIGCSSYPKCKFMEPLEKPEDTGVECPQCNKGSMLKRKSRRGKIFFSCSTYPDCDYAIWNKPLDEPCPTCAWPILTLKVTKRRGAEKVCPSKSCDFSEAVESDGDEVSTTSDDA